MNTSTKSEIELKLSAFEKLGDNPTEVDIKYVSYLLKIPLQTIRSWLEERAGILDFQIDISPVEEKECQIVGCILENTKIFNQSHSVKDEDALQKETQQSYQQPSNELKENQIMKKKKQLDKVKYCNPSKKSLKALQKQTNQTLNSIQSTQFEDCKTQDKNIQEVQNSNQYQSIQSQKLLQQNDLKVDSSKPDNKNTLPINNDNNIQQKQNQYTKQQAQRDKKINQQLQKNNQIRLEKEKIKINPLQLIAHTQNKGFQNQCLIVIDDEVNQKNFVPSNTNNHQKIQSSILLQNKQNRVEKQQTLQDLTRMRKKKIKSHMQSASWDILMGLNKQPENGQFQQNKQNLLNTHHQKQLINGQQQLKQHIQDQNLQQINQQQQQSQSFNQQQSYANFYQNQLINFGTQNHQQFKQKHQDEKKISNKYNQNLTQPNQDNGQNININLQSSKLSQQQNYLALVCSSQQQINSNIIPNQILPNQTDLQVQQNYETLTQKLNSIDSELNQVSFSQNSIDKKQQLPSQFEIVQMFNKSSQALGQAVQLITTFNNYQDIMLEKLNMIYQCVSKK